MTRPKKRELPRGDGDVLRRTRADGTVVYQARWYEQDALVGLRRRSQTFATEDAALAHLRETALKKLTGDYLPPADRMVRDLIAEWLERGKSRWKPATVAAYTDRADKHVIPALGAIRADRLTTPRIQHWIDALGKSGLDASTIDGVSRILSAALREAVQIGVLARNPAEGVRRPPVQVREPDTWTAEEVARVMAQLADDPFWLAVYRVMLATGMRPGELRALKWSDLDWTKGVLTIRRTMSKDAEGHVIVGETTKTRKSRQNALSPAALKVLKSWETEQKIRRVACADWHDEGLIFDRGDGRFLPATTWQHLHDRVTIAANVTRISLHGLRHTHATLELEAGTHPLIVSRRLGHAGIQTTLDRYSHVSDDLQRAAAESLDARLFGPQTQQHDAEKRG